MMSIEAPRRDRRRSWLRKQLNQDVDEMNKDSQDLKKRKVGPIELVQEEEEEEEFPESPGARIIEVSPAPIIPIGCFASYEGYWYESLLCMGYGESYEETEADPPIEMISECGTELSFQLQNDELCPSDDEVPKRCVKENNFIHEDAVGDTELTPESRRQAILSLIPQRRSKQKERRSSAPFSAGPIIERQSSSQKLHKSAPTSPIRGSMDPYFSSPRRSLQNIAEESKDQESFFNLRDTMRRRSDSEGPEGFRIAIQGGGTKKSNRPRSMWSRWREPLRRLTRSSSITLDTPRLPLRMVFLANAPRAARRKLRLCTSSRIDEYYDIRERIGKGAFGTVRKCTNKITHEVCAVKTVRRSRQNGAQGLSCTQANYESDSTLIGLISIAEKKSDSGHISDARPQSKRTGSFFSVSSIEHPSIVEEKDMCADTEKINSHGDESLSTQRQSSLIIPRESSPRRASSIYTTNTTPRHNCLTKGPATQEEIDVALRNEIEILGNMHHPNIVNLYDVFDDPESDQVHMVMQLCLGGELTERISAGLSEMEAAVVTLQMLLAIEYLHEMGIVHRDLKPQNLIYVSPGPQSDLVLIDFGVSTFFQKEKPLGTALGTIFYTAPEVFESSYGNKCDVWSIGIILYSLFTKGKRPFGKPGMSQHLIYKRIRDRPPSFSDQEWDTVSQAARNFIQTLLTKDSKLRPSATQALKDNWFEALNISTLAAYGDDILVLLARYKQLNPFKKLAYTLIAKDLTQTEIGFLKQQYRLLDTDGDGNITVKELLSAIRALENYGQLNVSTTTTPRTELEALLGRENSATSNLPSFFSADCEQDIVLDMDEFIAATFRDHMEICDENVRSAFAKFDRGCKGYIVENDLYEFFPNREYANKVFATIDTNSDGAISYEEFRAMLDCETHDTPTKNPVTTDYSSGKSLSKDKKVITFVTESTHKNDSRPFFKRSTSSRRTLGRTLSSHSRIVRYASSKLYRSNRVNPAESDGASSTPFSQQDSPLQCKTAPPKRSSIRSFL